VNGQEGQVEQMEEVCFLLSYTIIPTDWEVLSDRQKDLLAGGIDHTATRIDAREGNRPDDPLAYTPEVRWWRTDQAAQMNGDAVQSTAPPAVRIEVVPTLLAQRAGERIRVLRGHWGS